MKLYEYEGPIMVFNTCVASNWRGSTYAVSEEKARNNLTYQAKKLLNKLPNTRVTLPGKITLVR
jgi:hypothetical protein